MLVLDTQEMDSLTCDQASAVPSMLVKGAQSRSRALCRQGGLLTRSIPNFSPSKSPSFSLGRGESGDMESCQECHSWCSSLHMGKGRKRKQHTLPCTV